MFIWCAVGLLCASAYVAVAPRQYEASWFVKMAQFQNANIEDPSVLVERLRTPTVFPMDAKLACGYSADRELGEYLDGALKVSAMKAGTYGVMMKLRSSSPSRAKECADAITSMLMRQQKEMINDRLSGRREQMAKYEQALKEEQNLLEGRGANIGSISYLVRMDRMSWLRARIEELQVELAMSQLHPTTVLAPVYVPSKPVSPKVRLMLILGTVLGLLAGLLNAGLMEYRRRSAVQS